MPFKRGKNKTDDAQSPDTREFTITKMLSKRGETYPLDAQGQSLAKMILKRSHAHQPDAQDTTNMKALFKPWGARG